MKNVFTEGFRVNGNVYIGDNIPALVRKAVEELEKLPFKELVTTRQLAGMVNCANNTMQQHAVDPSLKDHRFTPPGRSIIFWGGRRTIKELKRVNKG